MISTLIRNIVTLKFYELDHDYQFRTDAWNNSCSQQFKTTVTDGFCPVRGRACHKMKKEDFTSMLKQSEYLFLINGVLLNPCLTLIQKA